MISNSMRPLGYSKRLFSNVLHCNPWKIGTKHKNIIGSRTVIVSSANTNKMIIQRLCFELNRSQIQAATISLLTPLPILPSHNNKNPIGGLNPLVDAISIFKRTGARSIITVGDGSVINFGKILRSAVESGKNTNQLFDHLRKNYVQRKLNIETNEPERNVKLISLGYMPSPSFFSSSAITLDNSDDVLFENVLAKPDIVGFDESLKELNPFFDNNYFKSYFLGLMFDVLFSFSFSALQLENMQNNEDFTLKSIESKALRVLDKVKNKVDINMLNSSYWYHSQDTKINYDQFSGAMENLIKIRENVESSVEFYPGITHLATNITFLESMSNPFSYNIIQNNNILFNKVLKLEKIKKLNDFQEVLNHFNEIKNNDYYQDIDSNIIESVLVSLSLIEKISSFPNPLVHLTKKIQLDNLPKSYDSNKDGSITSVGLIEQFLIDASDEDANSPILFDVDLQKKLAKSDFFNDFIDKILKSKV